MKFYKTMGLWKASNVVFDPKQVQALSYDWWAFVKKINGKIIFNNFPYSNTTIKHQHKVKRLLNDLGFLIDYEVSCSVGLQDKNWKTDALRLIDNQIIALSNKIGAKGSRKAKNAERLSLILKLEKQKQIIKTIKD